MNKFLNGLTDAANLTFTENGALTHRSTKSDLLDMFALGGAYRNRSDEEVLQMFSRAYAENPVYALKCLFYLRDVRGGQGERRFFRVVLPYFANKDPEKMRELIQYIPEFGRWDDLYCLVGTPVEDDVFNLMKEQLLLDASCKTPSLLAKWLKSENTSSAESRRLGNITRAHFGMTHPQYRKMLSTLRERINVLERLMSAGKWDEIEFDKIPSKAGLIYKNAFARRDIIKAKYESFAKDETTTVNASTLYPYDVVHEYFKCHRSYTKIDLTDRLMLNKYWDNLTDYFNNASFNGLAVVDTSGSMSGRPIEVALSLGMYCAEKAQGPFKDHFITFSEHPELQHLKGADFVDKLINMNHADWGWNTNIERVFDLLLETAISSHCSQDEIPQNIIIISDMEFDSACYRCSKNINTLFENIKLEWQRAGYIMPKLVFWNVDARQNNIPMRDDGNVNYVSGFSPVLFEQIMKNLTAYDLMMDKLNSNRYECIK